MSCFWGRIGTNHSKIKRWAVSGRKEGQNKTMSRIWGRMFPPSQSWVNQSLKDNSCFLWVVNIKICPYITSYIFYKYIVWVLFQMHLSRTQWDKVYFRVESNCLFPCDFTRNIIKNISYCVKDLRQILGLWSKFNQIWYLCIVLEQILQIVY